MDIDTRVFAAFSHVQPSDDTPIRSVVLETAEAVIVVWYVKPGQEIAAHSHPHGQDTWTILSGTADYVLETGQTRPITTHDIVVAKTGQVHGARVSGDEPLVFVSVVAPGNAGYALAKF